MSHEHRAGFTLIELLVVISIISLLSSVVLSAVNTARQKAANSQVLSVASEYRNAIELYRFNDPNGELPDPGNTVTTYCLGSYPDTGGFCDSNSFYPENADLITALTPTYLPTFPTTKPVSWSGSDYYGPLYVCTSRPGGICTKANMLWKYDATANPTYNCLGRPGVAGHCLYEFR